MSGRQERWSHVSHACHLTPVIRQAWRQNCQDTLTAGTRRLAKRFRIRVPMTQPPGNPTAAHGDLPTRLSGVSCGYAWRERAVIYLSEQGRAHPPSSQQPSGWVFAEQSAAPTSWNCRGCDGRCSEAVDDSEGPQIVGLLMLSAVGAVTEVFRHVGSRERSTTLPVLPRNACQAMQPRHSLAKCG